MQAAKRTKRLDWFIRLLASPARAITIASAMDNVAAAEEQLCSRLAEAARRGDECRMRELAWELVGRSLPRARRKARLLLPAPRWCREDREDAVSKASVRLFVALLEHDEPVAGMPASALAALCLRRTALDLCRERARRWGRESPTDPAEIPEAPIDPPRPPVEQAAAMGGLLEAMSEREATIVYEHHVRELDLAEIARRHGTSVPAVKKALSRGKRKAREAALNAPERAPRDGDVPFRGSRNA